MKRAISYSLIVLLVSLCARGQNEMSVSSSLPPIMFWNVENYFNPFDNPDIDDDDFTPEGAKHYTWHKYKIKRNLIAKTIMASCSEYGTWPYLIGLAEVEERYVLSDLIEGTPLAKLGYGIVHRNSPDARGIDVALIYREEYFEPAKVEKLNVGLQGKKTRDILYIKGIGITGDTLHVFVNHWPSKIGGDISESYREKAATVLMSKVDSIYGHSSSLPMILIMGDFNNTPDSPAVSFLISQRMPLINKAGEYMDEHHETAGSYNYKGQWEMIDQFIVSPHFSTRRMEIFSPKFLMKWDSKYLSYQPFRTYNGMKFQGGASDHFPIVLISSRKN